MSNVSMRDHFGKALIDLGIRHREIVVLDADLATSTRTSFFQERFPKRFINVGISEQDMLGIAAGLASSGKIPIATGYAMFTVGRAWEQIANSVARQNLNVKIVVSHAGLSNFADGSSHQHIFDLATMRVLPNMKVVVPADAFEAVKALEAIIVEEGPAYLRLARGKTPAVYREGQEFTLGRANIIKKGADAAIIASGVMVSQALEASRRLKEDGIEVSIIDMHTIKPLDTEVLLDAAKETGAIVTVEEHSLLGGLGGAVSEFLSQENPTPIKMVGIRDRFGESSRDYWRLLAKYGLTSEAVEKAVHEVLEMKKKVI
ncbi:MAG: transketolase family protein [Candidatus Bathyarchaeia archaeon]